MIVQIPTTTIRDTVAAVFSDGAYHHATLLDRVLAWLGDLLAAIDLFLEPGSMPSGVLWMLLLVAVALLLGPTLRMALLLRTRRLDAMDTSAGGRTFGMDPWMAAKAFAAQGDYTSAAHALYAALLDAIAARDEIELHESKTIGDYLRDLARGSSPFHAGFRAFARDYEVVIYRMGSCDRDRYDQLHGMARTMIGSRG